MITFNVTPMGKPRMTQRDCWKKRPCVLKYFKFKDSIKIQAKRQGYALSDTLEVIFYIPMPKSWPKKKKALLNGKPHKQRPDIDNILKGLLDTLLVDDSIVHDVTCKKIWAYKGSIVIK